MRVKIKLRSKKSGADIVGSDDLIEKISSGKFNFQNLYVPQQ